MTIYIVSYTCYDEYDYYLYTWRKPLCNWQDAQDLFKANVETARANITYEDGGYTTYDEKCEDFKHTFERLDSYSKIIVELTTHEL